jgi:hypothetical protein
LLVFVLCLVYPKLPVSLDHPFLIAPSGFSNVYLFQIRVVDDEVSIPWYWKNGYCYSIGDPCIMSFDYM